MVKDAASKLPEHAYFSRHHIARDFIGGVSTFTLALIVAYILNINISEFLDNLVIKVKDSKFIANSVIFVVAYFFIGYSLSILGNGLTASLIEFVPKRTAYLTKFSSQIGKYYLSCFGEKASMGSDDELSDKVYILVDYLEHVNAIGYSKVSRLYTISAILRQLVFYTILLLIFELFESPSSFTHLSILSVALIVFCFGVASVSRATFRAQLRFIVTSTQLREDVSATPAKN